MRLFLRSLVALFFLFVIYAALAVESVPGQNGPEPAPWWMRVEEAQDLAIKWLGFITAVGMAFMCAILVLWTKYKELRDRMNRASIDRQQLQAQVTDLAKQLPPPAAPAVVLVDGDAPKPAGSGIVSS